MKGPEINGKSRLKVKRAMTKVVPRVLMPMMSEGNAAQSRPTFYHNNLQILSLA
jgi:hypothetical protein